MFFPVHSFRWYIILISPITNVINFRYLMKFVSAKFLYSKIPLFPFVNNVTETMYTSLLSSNFQLIRLFMLAKTHDILIYSVDYNYHNYYWYYYHQFGAQIVPDLVTENSFKLDSVSFWHVSIITSLLPGTKYYRIIWYILYPTPGTSHLSKQAL